MTTSNDVAVCRSVPNDVLQNMHAIYEYVFKNKLPGLISNAENWLSDRKDMHNLRAMELAHLRTDATIKEAEVNIRRTSVAMHEAICAKSLLLLVAASTKISAAKTRDKMSQAITAHTLALSQHQTDKELLQCAVRDLANAEREHNEAVRKASQDPRIEIERYLTEVLELSIKTAKATRLLSLQEFGQYLDRRENLSMFTNSDAIACAIMGNGWSSDLMFCMGLKGQTLAAYIESLTADELAEAGVEQPGNEDK